VIDCEIRVAKEQLSDEKIKKAHTHWGRSDEPFFYSHTPMHLESKKPVFGTYESSKTRLAELKRWFSPQPVVIFPDKEH
jgi:hypothetical protein